MPYSKSSFKSKRKNLADCCSNQLDLFDHSVIAHVTASKRIVPYSALEIKRHNMNTRQLKGISIAERFNLKQDNNIWLVPSESKSAKYKVDLQKQTCTCPDHDIHKNKCKHIFAAEYRFERSFLEAIEIKTENETPVEIPKVKRPTYPQQWREYNQAQTNEKRQFQYLLHNLCQGAGSPASWTGRPRIPIEDMLFACAFKVYSTFSGRRFMTDLSEAHKKGYISKLPCYNSMFNYFDDEMLTPYLQMLIEESAKPLAVIESSFAVDSTGISTNRFVQWVHAKYSDPQLIEKKVWIKMHVCCGVKTNVVSSVEITDRFAGDSPMFKPLVERTAQHFVMDEVSADKAYLSNDNLAVVARHAAMPYIPFKSDSNPHSATATNLWTKMYHYFALNQERFFKHYHKRSNVETTFMMIKAKFGDAIRSKTERAQINEALCKVLCHNICCLISAMYELGLKPKFWSAI